MKSIDNLREYALTAASVNATTRAVLAGYIDGIEREVEELRDRDYRNGREDAKGAVEFADRLKAAVDKRADVTLFGVDYTALPLDAEGEAIHVGDVMELAGGDVEKVESLHNYGSEGWSVTTTHNATVIPWSARHHHAPTVEDVLYDSLRHFGAVEERTPEVDEWLHEQAAKLRLEGDE